MTTLCPTRNQKLQWMGEPVQGQRVRLGVWVLLFLGVFTVIAWRLNASYWKDIK